MTFSLLSGEAETLSPARVIFVLFSATNQVERDYQGSSQLLVCRITEDVLLPGQPFSLLFL